MSVWQGVIIISHGSRSCEAQLQFMKIVQKVKERSLIMVEGAFMEFAKPSFEEAVKGLAAQGIKKIAVYPLFLFSGIHVKEDIPEMIKMVEKKHPTISFKMIQPIGLKDELIDMLLNGIEELEVPNA